MSRIDDALRRARARRTGIDAGERSSDAHAVESPVVPAWQYERFPAEAAAAARADRRSAPRTDPSVAAPSRPAREAQAAAAGVRYATAGVAPRYSEKVVGGPAALSSREQYARVAAALHQAQGRQQTRIVMIASAIPGEGKTLTAANVALTLSESYGRRVLLIDGDLRRPTLHELFQVSAPRGLLDGLEAGSEQRLPLIDVSPRLSVLPAGSATADPMRLLISDRMRTLLREAAESFDWVIVDTPPVALVPDAHVLADMVDAVVFVIRAGSTPHDLITNAVNAVGRTRVLGVVLNGVEESDLAGGGRYGYGYGYGQTRG